VERLKDRRFTPGSPEATASELLRALPPRAVSLQLKRRVRERLLEGRAKPGLSPPLRPALATTALIVAGGAAAAIGHARLSHPKPGGAAEPRLAMASALPSAPSAILSPAQQSPPPASAAASPIPEPRHADARANGARTSDKSVLSEASLVYGAAKALHSAGDLARAAQLLDEYGRHYPHGALAEEALALTLDLSLARGDGRAGRLAQRYLVQYPNGHFRAKAERVLATP